MATFPGAGYAEGLVHDRLAHSRVNEGPGREWFSASLSDVLHAIGRVLEQERAQVNGRGGVKRREVKKDGTMVEGGTLLVLLLRARCQRSALQGSSSNGRGRNITCLPFVCALPAFGVSVAARLVVRSSGKL